MFENQSQPLLARKHFLRRFFRSVAMGTGIIFGSLYLGMLGFREFEGMTWIDAFLNASMLLSGMGPIGSPVTEYGKLFAGIYALYSGFVVILASSIVFAPVIHRMLHRFHTHQQHHRGVTAAGAAPNIEPPPVVAGQGPS